MDDTNAPAPTSLPPEKATPAALAEIAKAVRHSVEAAEALAEGYEEVVGRINGASKAVTEGLQDFDRRLQRLEVAFGGNTEQLKDLTKTVHQLGTLLLDIRKSDKEERQKLEQRMSAAEIDIGALTAELAAKFGILNGPRPGDPS